MPIDTKNIIWDNEPNTAVLDQPQTTTTPPLQEMPNPANITWDKPIDIKNITFDKTIDESILTKNDSYLLPPKLKETFISALPKGVKPPKEDEAYKAKSMNIYSISKYTKLPISTVRGNYDILTQELGMRDMPTTPEFISKTIQLGIMAGLPGANPLALLKYGLIGTGLETYKSALISDIKKEPFRYGRKISELYPEETSEGLKQFSNIVEDVATLTSTGALGRSVSAANVIGNKVTKINLARQIMDIGKAKGYMPSEAKLNWLKGFTTKLSEYELQMLKTKLTEAPDLSLAPKEVTVPKGYTAGWEKPTVPAEPITPTALTAPQAPIIPPLVPTTIATPENIVGYNAKDGKPIIDIEKAVKAPEKPAKVPVEGEVLVRNVSPTVAEHRAKTLGGIVAPDELNEGRMKIIKSPEMPPIIEKPIPTEEVKTISPKLPKIKETKLPLAKRVELLEKAGYTEAANDLRIIEGSIDTLPEQTQEAIKDQAGVLLDILENTTKGARGAVQNPETGEWINISTKSSVPSELQDIAKGKSYAEIEKVLDQIIKDDPQNATAQRLKGLIVEQIKEGYKHPLYGEAPAQPELLSIPKENIAEKYERLTKQYIESGLTPNQARLQAKIVMEQEKGKVTPAEQFKAKQQEISAKGGIEGFGIGKKGEQELFTKPQYSICEEDYGNVIEGKPTAVTKVKKIIPPRTATKEVIEWEKTPAWQVNLGRNITGIFEREIGPRLQVSKRFKRWLGVYYPMLGESGTIRVWTLADEKTLAHETGHFLDDVLGKYPIEKRGDIRDELIEVTKFLKPFEERYVPIIDKETGLPKISKKTKKPLMKQDTYTAYRRSRGELFADYISAYVHNPIKAKELAPGFTDIVETEIAKDKEFKYIIDKLREFETAFKLLRNYVNALRKIPKIEPLIKDWETKGSLLENIWKNTIGDKVWDLLTSAIDKLGQKPVAREFCIKAGLNDQVFEVLRQTKKLIDGQTMKLDEEIIKPIYALSEKDQRYIAETLQNFELLGKDATELGQLTESARKEIAVWGNEARNLGLLNDEVFWNNVGQYMPFFYTEKDFNINKAKFGFFPAKRLRANLSGFKHKLTDIEMGREVLKARFGTFPSQLAKIEQYGNKELAEIGRNAREEMGLIKTAAYPIQKRLTQLIQTVYTVRAMNAIAKIPGQIGEKGMPGYIKLAEGKRYGDLSGQYVPENLAKYIMEWSNQVSDIGKVWDVILSSWKILKVPYDAAVVMNNLYTNAITMWLDDIPVYNPVVTSKGIKSFITKDKIYEMLRDNGLYKHTYSRAELQGLELVLKKDPENIWEAIIHYGLKTFKAPADFYGYLEDMSKTIVARYAMDNGATPIQAVKKADKILFDYRLVSKATSWIRKFPIPFYTWASKVIPLLFETAIRRPQKFIYIYATMAVLGALSRMKLGITKKDEDKIKPDRIRGKPALLMPSKDKNGQHNWIDLSRMFFGNLIPIENGKFAVPSALTFGNPIMSIYNAYVLNYDPFYGEIVKDYMSDEEANEARLKYLTKSLGAKLATKTVFDLHKAIGKEDKTEIGRIISGDIFGIKIFKDISADIFKMYSKYEKDLSMGISNVLKKRAKGEYSAEKAQRLIDSIKTKYKENIESHKRI